MNDAPYGPLFEEMDRLAPSLGEEVVMQVGRTGFRGVHSRCFQYLPDAEMEELFDSCSLIVSHAGIGTIVNGLDRRIPLVLVPRTVVMPETDADQQMTVAGKVEAMGRGVMVRDLSELGAKISEARALRLGPYERDRSLLSFLSDLLAGLSEEPSEKPLQRARKEAADLALLVRVQSGEHRGHVDREEGQEQPDHGDPLPGHVDSAGQEPHQRP